MEDEKLLKRLNELESYKKEVENSYGNIAEKERKIIKLQSDIISYMWGTIDRLEERNTELLLENMDLEDEVRLWKSNCS